MNRLISLGLRRAWRRGVLEGSRTWLAVGGVALAARALQRVAGRRPVVVYSEELGAGQTVVISNGLPTPAMAPVADRTRSATMRQ